MNPHDNFQLAQALGKLTDGTLDAEGLHALQETLRSDPAAHAFAARFLHLEGELKVSAPGMEKHLSDPASPETRIHRLAFSRSVPWSLAAAAAIALLLALVFRKQPDVEFTHIPEPETVATLTEAKNCRWAESSLPTVQGSRIGPGFYELVEGLATFTFESGAVLTLEAPSTLEITDAMNCHLRKGALIADVPESAIGFTVDTMNAKVVDFGTKFGVSANDDGYYTVQVLEGLVEVTDKKDKKTRPLTIGKRISVGETNFPESSSETPNPARSADPDFDDGWQRLTTAYGNGADTFIQLGTFQDTLSALREFGHDPSMRVKRADKMKKTCRKSYIRFDLTALEMEKLSEGKLSLTIVPGELGFASLCPDATFSVYGLTDESQDSWSEIGRNWESAPAHLPESTDYHLPDPSKTTKLGEFTIEQGTTSGTVSIEGNALVDFLKSDTNGLATFVVCRDTDELDKGGYAHEFATRENRTASAPTLKIRYGK